MSLDKDYLKDLFTDEVKGCLKSDGDPVGTAANTVSEHNTSTDAHSDIRLLVAGLTSRLNSLADSDDTTLDQVSELVEYIKVNRSLIEQVTTGKVSVSDIIDNLTTKISNKPLSAAQGVKLKALIDAITVPTKVSELQNDAGYLTQHQDISGKANASDLTAHTGNSTVHITADERTKWNQAVTDVGNLSGEIVNYLPKNQGSTNVGKILVVGTDGNLTLTDMPEGGSSGDVIGTLDEANNILLTGNLAYGTYTLKYENANGTVTEIGDLVVSSIAEFSIITTLENCTSSGATSIRANGSATVTITANTGYALPDSITVSGASHTWDKSTGNIVLSNPTSDVYITVTAEKTITNFAEYNADNTTDWNIWINNARIGSDGTYRSDTTDGELGTPAVSNYIAVQNGDTVEFEGIYTKPKSSMLCDSNKTKIENGAIGNLTNITDITESTALTYAGQFTINNPNTAFIRIGGYVGVYNHPVSDIRIKIKRNGEYL